MGQAAAVQGRPTLSEGNSAAHHLHPRRVVLEAHPDGPYILLRREGEPGSVRVHLNEVRYLAEAMCTTAAAVARRVAQFE
ncbi:MAG TPA: hypothetical protein VMY98_07830 [Anaerolineae bacterium]|nr:hypothetical protein [Anaerolineae bacterium]